MLNAVDVGIAAVSFMLFIVFIVFKGAYQRRLRNPHGLPYPPGPATSLLVGNFFAIPKETPYLEYANWSKRYNSARLMFMTHSITFILTMMCCRRSCILLCAGTPRCRH